MLCSISGNTPEEPVISIKSGYIYEKRLIEKYIEANGKEPVTGEPLNLNELVPVKVGKFVKPRPTNATSIPSMLQMFQNEWDSLMLETFTLKQQYENIRQELAHSIYQYDAACRVIARLIKERDSIKNQFMNSRLHNGSSGNNNNNNNNKDIIMEDSDQNENQIIPESDQSKILKLSEQLIKARKQRVKPEGLPTVEDIKKYKPTIDISPHSQKPINCLDLKSDNLILSGGDDLSIQVYDIKAKESKTKISNAHTKRINQVLFHPTSNLLFSCSDDKVVKVWSSEGGVEQQNTSPIFQFNEHRDSVSGISLHPTGDYLASSSLDKSWKLYDINTGKTLTTVRDSSERISPQYTSIQIAPDGLILALGTAEKVISVWEINSMKKALDLGGLTSQVQSISFSENGYYLAAADQQSVKLFDLRKCAVIQDIQLPGKSQVKSVTFDYSGSYLSVVGTDVNLYNVHGKTNPIHFIQSFHHNNGILTDTIWSKNSSFFVTSSLDSTLKIWANSH